MRERGDDSCPWRPRLRRLAPRPRGDREPVKPLVERTPSDIGCEHGSGRKLRVREQDVQREVLDEAEKRLPVTAIEELFPGIGDDRSRLLVLSGVDGVRDRADEKAVLGQPVRGHIGNVEGTLSSRLGQVFAPHSREVGFVCRCAGRHVYHLPSSPRNT